MGAGWRVTLSLASSHFKSKSISLLQYLSLDTSVTATIHSFKKINPFKGFQP